MDLVKEAITKKYATFSGRARRKEYWLFFLFAMVVNIILRIVDGAIGTLDYQLGLGLLSGIFSLAILIPSIAVAVRRLHDTDRKGWWFLLIFVPIVGAIALIIFFCMKGTDGENRFGSDPLAGEE